MLRGPIAANSYKVHFSGHQKFPMRYGWLTKLYEEYAKRDSDGLAYLLKSSDAIAELGIGKNMVGSIKYWGVACGLFFESNNGRDYVPTELGERLLGKEGWDPYLEDPASLWLLHWRLAGWPTTDNRAHKTTTWLWAFNYFGVQNLDKGSLTKSLQDLCELRGWAQPSSNTLTADIECFFKTYTYSRNHDNQLTEDSLECPLAELNLVSQGTNGIYEFNRGKKISLPQGVFNFALMEFWARYTKANTLTVDQIAYEPGSPGLVFKLDESEIVERLSSIEQSTEGCFTWTETAGLRQVAKRAEPDDIVDLLSTAFNQQPTSNQLVA